MDPSGSHLIEIEPKKALNFEGPFTEVVVSHIQLQNPQEFPVCFKVKTTVPRNYCVRPSSGILKPGETLKVAVMLQPFAYDPHERCKHKFMIQCMRLPDDEGLTLDQVWKQADPTKISDWKLVCVLRVPGELVIEPSHDVVFDGPVSKPMTASITLTNPSSDPVYFKVQAPASQNITAIPTSDMIQPGQACKVTVKSKPLDVSGSDVPREKISIKSVAVKQSEKRTPEELLETPEASNVTLKCVYSAIGSPVDEKVKSVKQTGLGASPHEGSKVNALMDELNTLRKENKMLKEADIQLRRSALSDTCLTSAADGGAAIGRHGALGAIAIIPPILYLILAFFIGLLLGKFAL